MRATGRRRKRAMGRMTTTGRMTVTRRMRATGRKMATGRGREGEGIGRRGREAGG
jgi:hypothetical protein